MAIIKVTEAAGDVRVEPGTVTNIGKAAVAYGDLGALDQELAPGESAQLDADPTWVRVLGAKTRLSHSST